MNFYIYTDVFYVSPSNLISVKCSTKKFLKSLLGIKSKGGHPSVHQSLLESTAYKQICHKNKLPTHYHRSNIACVLSSPDSLKVVLSKRHLYSKIIVGPNLFTSPLDFKSLPLDEAIDGYIVPSLTIQKYYQSFLSYLSINKDFFIWPADPSRRYLEYPNCSLAVNAHILFYIKFSAYSDKSFLKAISEILHGRSLPFSFIFYGQYSHSEYLILLSKSTHVFFLGIGESQCIAQFEAAAFGCQIYVLQESRFKNNPLVHTYPYYLADCAPYASRLNINILADCDSLLLTLTNTNFSDLYKTPPLQFADSFSILLASLTSSYE